MATGADGNAKPVWKLTADDAHGQVSQGKVEVVVGWIDYGREPVSS
jgi:hypothetical protein